MKKLLFFAFVLCAIACKKDSIPNGSKILKVTVDGKTHQSFEYDEKNRLFREKEYFSCTVNPVNEYVYTYMDSRLEKVNSVIRSHFSSITVMCGPSQGLQFEEVFSYDIFGRVIKVIRPATTTEYTYNQQGFISKAGGTNFSYDSRGNVIKTIDSSGNIMEYEYDSAPNPFYTHRPGMATPFTMSPNNIIKGKGTSNFERKIEYKSNMPITVLEDNGRTYEYHYR